MEAFSDNKKAVKCAETLGLTFHIETFYPAEEASGGIVVEHRGWKSEDRDATEEELEMWRILMRMIPEDGPENESL